jgi:aspartate aminotransferase
MSSVQKSLIRQIFDGAPKGSINLALGEPVFDIPDWFYSLINRDVINDFAYSPTAGTNDARKAVITINDYPGTWEDVCIVCGAEEGLSAGVGGVKLYWGGKKNELLFPSPYFLTYPTISKMMGMDQKTYPIPPFCKGRVADSIREHISDKTAVVLLNTPANPSGLMMTEEDIREAEAICDEYDAFLLVDEVYRFFGNTKKPVCHNWTSVGNRTIIVSSLTKSFGLPGLRLGWAFTRHSVINQIFAAHQAMVAIAPTISQLIVSRFPDYDFKKWLDENRNRVIENRKLITEELRKNDLEYVPTLGSFYVLFKIPEAVLKAMGEVDFAFYLKDHFGILTVPGKAFGDYSHGFMRLSYGGHPDTFPEGIRRIRKGIDSIVKK